MTLTAKSRHKKKCSNTGKIRYTSYQAALEALLEVEQRTQQNPLSDGVYWCKLCTSFHITSRRFKRPKSKRGKTRRGF